MFPSSYMIIIKPLNEKKNGGRARKMMHFVCAGMHLWETVYRKKKIKSGREVLDCLIEN